MWHCLFALALLFSLSSHAETDREFESPNFLDSEVDDLLGQAPVPGPNPRPPVVTSCVAKNTFGRIVCTAECAAGKSAICRNCFNDADCTCDCK